MACHHVPVVSNPCLVFVFVLFRWRVNHNIEREGTDKIEKNKEGERARWEKLCKKREKWDRELEERREKDKEWKYFESSVTENCHLS